MINSLIYSEFLASFHIKKVIFFSLKEHSLFETLVTTSFQTQNCHDITSYFQLFEAKTRSRGIIWTLNEIRLAVWKFGSLSMLVEFIFLVFLKVNLSIQFRKRMFMLQIIKDLRQNNMSFWQQSIVTKRRIKSFRGLRVDAK